MNCPACGTAAAPGTKFCAECGTSLAAGCPSCGTQNGPGAKFCVECGTNLSGAAFSTPAAAATPETAAPATGAERRLVSVLFADLVGSTTMAEDRDPEETRELLTRYFETCTEVIARYGGTVEKFIGDAVMAVWGVPVAHEDDAERAVRAALDLVAAVGATTDGDRHLALRAAVLTGEAAATVGAAGQSMVAGDLVNTAARLQGAAPPGSVLVGEATWRATHEAVAYQSVGEQALKGKTEQIAAWRALHVLSLRGGAGRKTTLEPPFVGRDDDLRLVRDLFHATAREGKPRLISIIGQAGIGKHRLAWEFEKYIDGVTETAYWHSGRSPAYGEGISFWALAEMVRHRARITEGADPAEAARQLAETVAEFVTDAEERRWIEPRLAGLLGLEPMPPGEEGELFGAWRTFFERIAARDPVILVFGDLHWADQGLMDFIEHLLTWARSSPILVVALARPELLERRPGWGTNARNAVTITLEPLATETMGELLRGLVPGLPPDATAAIVERSEGIPLYAVETVRMLLDTGQLRPEGDAFALTGSLTDLKVPETLRALVAARLDANDPTDRALLTDAAVLGQSFTLSGLAGMTGRPAEELQPGLDRLIRRELLIRDDDPRSPERGQYRFVQAVVREVAQESLARKDRRAKHLAAARHLESLGDDELAGVLASHYLEAYRAAPEGEEADALAAQARIALRAAAERSAALHSHASAVHYLEEAISVTADPAERAALYERAAESASSVSGLSGYEHALKAIELYREVGDDEGVLRATVSSARAGLLQGFGSQSVAALEGVLAVTPNDAPDWPEAMGELARAYMLTGRDDEAVATADAALAAIGTRRLPRLAADILVTRGTALKARLDEAEAILRGAVAIADRSGHAPTMIRARNNLLTVVAGDITATELIGLCAETAELARRTGNERFLAQMLLSIADTAFEAGGWQRADAALAELAVMDLDPFRRTWYVLDSGFVKAFHGDFADARESVTFAEAEVAGIDTYHLSGKEAMAARVILILGDAEQAADRALAAATSGKADYNVHFVALMAAGVAAPGRAAELLPVLAESAAGGVLEAARSQAEALVAADQGRWDDARAGFRAAIAGFDALERGFYRAIVGFQWEHYLGQRDPDAGQAGADAEALCVAGGGAPFVEGYRAAFTVPGAPPASGTTPAKRPVPVDAEQPA